MLTGVGKKRTCLNFHRGKNADHPRRKNAYTWYGTNQKAREKNTYYRWKYELVSELPTTTWAEGKSVPCFILVSL